MHNSGGHPPARRNIHNYRDSYLNQSSSAETSVCRECGNYAIGNRWYAKGEKSDHHRPHPQAHAALCPACAKMRDHVPGGLVTIRGDFHKGHMDEILNLIENQESNARHSNPLERVMSISAVDGVMEIQTTNERLAQRIGHALKSAYSGEVRYNFSTDDHFARVTWERYQTP